MKRLVIVLLVMLFVLGMVTQGWAQTTPTPPKTGGELKLDMESTFQMGVTAMSSQGLVKHVTQGIMVNTNGWLRMKSAISFAVPDNSRDAQLWLQSGFGVYTPLPPLKEGGKPSEVIFWVTNWNMRMKLPWEEVYCKEFLSKSLLKIINPLNESLCFLNSK